MIETRIKDDIVDASRANFVIYDSRQGECLFWDGTKFANAELLFF